MASRACWLLESSAEVESVFLGAAYAGLVADVAATSLAWLAVLRGWMHALALLEQAAFWIQQPPGKITHGIAVKRISFAIAIFLGN